MIFKWKNLGSNFFQIRGMRLIHLHIINLEYKSTFVLSRESLS